jgi:hypothetical protein
VVTAVTVRGVEASVVSLAVGRGSQSHQIVQFEIRHVTATDRTLVDVTGTGTLFDVESDRRVARLCDGSSRRRPSGERVIDNIIHTQFPPNVCRMSN